MTLTHTHSGGNSDGGGSVNNNAEISRLKNKNDQLQKEMNGFNSLISSQNEELRELKQQLHRYKQDNEELKILQSNQVKTIGNLRKELDLNTDKLNKEMKKNKSGGGGGGGFFSKSNKDNDHKEDKKKIKELEKENDALKNENTKITKTLQSENDNLKMELESVNREVKRLQNQMKIRYVSFVCVCFCVCVCVCV